MDSDTVDQLVEELKRVKYALWRAEAELHELREHYAWRDKWLSSDRICPYCHKDISISSQFRDPERQPYEYTVTP